MGVREAIIFFSLFELAIGLTSIGLQIACIGWDGIGAGFWGGGLYTVAGISGLMGSCSKTPYSCMLVVTVIFTSLCIPGAVLAAVFSSISAYLTNLTAELLNRETVGALEWAIMASSVVSFVVNIVLLVLSSKLVCGCCQPPNNSKEEYPTIMVMPAGPPSNGAPMNYAPQQQQQQQPTHHAIVMSPGQQHVGGQQPFYLVPAAPGPYQQANAEPTKY